MKYTNANLILPECLIEEIQKYMHGGYLYIPVKKEKRKGWGELSGLRQEIDTRNQQIIEQYQSGTTIEELANAHFISIYAIKKIIYQR
ncbi:hypothetical protein D3C77_630190 [compost metagenome]